MTDGEADFRERVTSFSTGQRHLCGLDAEGELRCVGYGGLADFDLPDGPFDDVQCGYAWCCALRRPEAEGAGGALACFVAEGEDPAVRWRAYAVAGAFDTVRLGGDAGCARGLDGRLTCFARGGGAPPAAFVPRATPILDFDLTLHQICVIHDDEQPDDDGPLQCWGDQYAPVGRFKSLSSGFGGTCALRRDGTLHCWAGGDPAAFPAPPAGTFTAIEVGGNFACALDAAGRVQCWGGIH